jgi:septum formation protein
MIPVPPDPAASPPGRTLVLASTSRYRRDLLSRLGLPFTAVAPHADETPFPGETPAATALRLAAAKARSIVADWPQALIIGSDQVADADGMAVGKPGSAAAARAQLARLSGRTVVFHTGVALLDAATGLCRTALVDVCSRFRALSPATIDAYLAREQPYDCAGSVKSEGLGIALFEAIESDDPTALVGLPLISVVSMLAAAGVAVP